MDNSQLHHLQYLAARSNFNSRQTPSQSSSQAYTPSPAYGNPLYSFPARQVSNDPRFLQTPSASAAPPGDSLLPDLPFLSSFLNSEIPSYPDPSAAPISLRSRNAEVAGVNGSRLGQTIDPQGSAPRPANPSQVPEAVIPGPHPRSVAPETSIRVPTLSVPILPLVSRVSPEETSHAPPVSLPSTTNTTRSTNRATTRPTSDPNAIHLGYLCGYPHPSKPFTYCSAYFGSINEQRRHLTQHAAKEYKDHIQNKTGPGALVFGGTEILTEPTFCEYCNNGKEYSRADSMKRHIRAVHAGESGRGGSNRGRPNASTGILWFTYSPLPGSAEDFNLRAGFFPLEIETRLYQPHNHKRCVSEIVKVLVWAQQRFKKRIVKAGKEHSVLWVQKGERDTGRPFFKSLEELPWDASHDGPAYLHRTGNSDSDSEPNRKRASPQDSASETGVSPYDADEPPVKKARKSSRKTKE